MAQTGDIIAGKYRLDDKLGEGGMGAVFKATHTQIGAPVAIKFLNPIFSQQPDAIRRFQQEAVAAAKVGHETIIATHDIGVTDTGEHFIILEYLKGESLGQRLAGFGPLPPELAAYVCCQVLSGLTAAHKSGIIHRDLKPDNIFLVNTGASLPGVKILDFGISRIADPSANEQMTRLTRTGAVMGTPEYMSPEQARGREDVDHRADLYAVGVILYESLCGDVPFRGNNYNAVLVAILTEQPPPLTSVSPNVPEPLVEVVETALCRDRRGRYQSAEEMFGALMPLLDDATMRRIPMPSRIYEPPAQVSAADHLPGQLAPTPTPVPGTVVASQDRGGSDTATAWVHATPQPRGRAKHVYWLMAVAVFCVGAGVAAGLYAFETPDEPQIQPTALSQGEGPIGTSEAQQGQQSQGGVPTKAQDAQAAQPPEKMAKTVSITIKGVPLGAKVLIDDKAVAHNPVEVPWDDDVHEVRVEMDGFVPKTAVFVPTRPRTVQVPPLDKVPAEASPRSGRKRRDPPRSSGERETPASPKRDAYRPKLLNPGFGSKR